MRLLRRFVPLCLALVAIASGALTAPASADSGMFRANTVWNGQFGTPDVIKVGSTYWAYATTTGGDNLPITHSTDLRTWITRGAYPAAQNPGWWSGYNDALPHPARWALYYIHRNGRAFTSVWGPSVTPVAGRYVLTYAAAIGRANRHCVSMASSNSPAGPFIDNTRSPIVCAPDPGGSIDPQVVNLGGGKVYLIWKNAGVPGSKPTQIWARQLGPLGMAFAPGSRPRELMQTIRTWEGNVIENPAMIQYAGHWYLFYSGNNFMTPQYATGYAVCAGPLGPCRRPAKPGPLMASNAQNWGPGSASPFIGPRGQLMLAYAAWDAGQSGPSAVVRMHIATLAVGPGGALRVAARG